MKDAFADLRWVVLILIFLWVAWFFTGGSSRELAQGGPFIKPLAPLDTGETYGNLSDGPFKKSEGASYSKSGGSIFKDNISVEESGGAKESDPAKEFFVIAAPFSNKDPLYLSGWTIKNAAGGKETIVNATRLPLSGTVNTEEPLFLAPGERAIVLSGRSPLGVSFKVNKCAGYLEQFQDFAPSLSLSCPSAADDARTRDYALSPSCFDYLYSVPSCTFPVLIPGQVSAECAAFAQQNLTYNQCVSLHKDDLDFFTNEWRIYLGRQNEFWGNKADLIKLYDQSGNLVVSKAI